MEQYNFTIIDNQENTLYFQFIRKDKCEVRVCCPRKTIIHENTSSLRYPYGCLKPPSGEIVIPSKVEYKGRCYYVREIGNCAFYGCSSITKVFLPETIIKIGSFAFCNCRRLKSINIPNRVKIIGNNAFQKCELLKEIYLPNSLKELGSYVFDDCKSLVEVRLSDMLVNIERYSFRNCWRLETVNVPLSLLRISSNAFEYCMRLKAFDIPASIYHVSAGAFCGCNFKISSLSEEYIVKDNCLLYKKDDRYNLIYVPGTMEEYEIPEGVTWISDGIFNGCKKLRRIKLADSVWSIGWFTFSGCQSLQEVVVSDNSELREIGLLAFSYCRELIKITLPSSLKFLGRNAFAYCSLNIINKSYDFVAKDNALYTADYKRLIYVCASVMKFRIDDNVEIIDSCAFSSCRKLDFFILPKSFDEVPRLTFPYQDINLDRIYTLNETMEMESYEVDRYRQIPVRKITESVAELFMKELE